MMGSPLLRGLAPARRGLASLVPIVIESTSRGERSFDIFSRLLRERIVMVSGPIDEGTASVVVAQLLFLESEKPSQPISMYISSPGGHVTAGLAIYDTMQYIRPPVHTTCIGHASSMGSLLLCAGQAGERASLPNARIMLHQPSGGFEGQATDIGIRAAEMAQTRKRLAELYAHHTGQSYEVIERTLERDTFQSAEEAQRFGLIDRVLRQRPVPEQ